MFNYFNDRVKRLTAFDIGLTKLSVLIFTIALVKYFPALLMIRYRYLLILLIICAAKPVFVYFKK